MVRLKHRYLLVNILYPIPRASNKTTSTDHDAPYAFQVRSPSSDDLNARLLLRLIRDGVAELFGDYGSGKVSPSLQVKYLSPATSTAIIRVSRDHYRLVWAALSLVTKLPWPVDQPCVMQVVRVSGTIKKAEEEAIRRARLSIVRARRAAAGGQSSMTASEAAGETHSAVMEDGLGLANGIEDVEDLEAVETEDEDDDGD